MCEIMTVCAAAVLTAVYVFQRNRGCARKSVLTTALALWGAALMWSVDCMSSVLSGGPLLDMSAGDAVLGLIILAGGMILLIILYSAEKRGMKKH